MHYLQNKEMIRATITTSIQYSLEVLFNKVRQKNKIKI